MSLRRAVLLAGLLPFAAATDCPGPGVRPGCPPCPPPVTLVLTPGPGASGPIHDVALTATFSGAAHMDTACDEDHTPVRCTVFPIDNLGSHFDGTYTIGVFAPGFTSQELTVGVAPTDNPDNERCWCYYDAQEIDVTLAP